MTARPVADGLFDVDGDGSITLAGGFSPSSGRHHFPVAERCPYTGASDVQQVALPRTGTLWLWTSVTSPPPGYLGPVPYGYGVVVLDGIDLRVVTRLRVDAPAEGMAVRLVAEEVPTPDGPATTWAFAPA